jgi:hypothetical protein
MTFAGRLLALLVALAAPPAFADESVWDSLARSTGMTTSPPDPPDFVKATRPKAEPTSMPVFAPPDEPRSKIKSPSELKAMDADLEKAGRAQRARLGVGDPSDSKASAARAPHAKAKAAKSSTGHSDM